MNSFRSLLRKGELNQKLIKVDVPVDKGPSIRIGGGGIGGAEVIGQSSLRDLLSNLGGKKSTEQQELPVEEVRTCTLPIPRSFAPAMTHRRSRAAPSPAVASLAVYVHAGIAGAGGGGAGAPLVGH